MDADRLKAHCQAKPGAALTFPFGEEYAVYKVGGKMFALVLPDNPGGLARVNLKCDPIWSGLLRSTYAAVTPAYHMNKEHWNTIILDGSVPAGELERLVDHSYDLVFRSLKRSLRDSIQGAAPS